jgi:DUF4097 and DUF4098 domain-containing protein YvlB
MVVVLPALLILALSQSTDPCRHEAERSARINASAADVLRLVARAGSLDVQGRPGLTEVRVRGRACASSAALLDDLQLETRRAAGEVVVEVAEIDYGFSSNQYARLDLVLEVPQGMAADIRDGSGHAELRGLGRLTVEDGSGSLRIEDIAGPLRVHDGSGELYVRRVRGDVDIEDGSGEIDVAEVIGSVTISDGSGSISATAISGAVRVREDGSGTVTAIDVGGDLEVRGTRSERIHYRDVRGEIDVPAPRRKRR